MEENNKVLLGMSGGTDSSVAAMLLLDAGYEVTGTTFRFFEKDNNTEYLDDARELCSRLGIPHITYDLRDKFKEYIIDYFIKEYMTGRTPVPCTLCNNYLKWPILKEIADREGIYHIAWGLPQDIMKRMVLPLGNITKTRVREIAAERGFMEASVKKDSLGVCFCPMDYRSFLGKNVNPDLIKPGIFCDEEGNNIGKHKGYPFYTIGQRRGLGIYMNKALFVKEIIPEENKVVISDKKKFFLKKTKL